MQWSRQSHPSQNQRKRSPWQSLHAEGRPSSRRIYITSHIDKSGTITKNNDRNWINTPPRTPSPKTMTVLKVYRNWINTPVWTSKDNTSQGTSFLITGCKGDESHGITHLLMLKATWNDGRESPSQERRRNP